MDATIQELKERETEATKDYVLLDVREDYERSEFNVGGIHVPLGELMGSLDKLAPHKDDEVIVYCRSGKRSAMAAQLLTQSGFTNVRNLAGGMMAYLA
ncbi:rhodanese-like domain-containing protein [Neolewinella antarctica]|uniref:Rhodanese-related sulfurtransferase n=1 Tax=Neolewinella antarctica TaxID=442734 RepID=A0ABX0XEB4_9BACT|nr:rhodanese-like domain-containing protein [Neolewinella antarctica]NJC27586.1 rhodanese-related sulfurtransferase [Neolewinella antarctica]